jgi:PAS domain S-box-containing protein
MKLGLRRAGRTGPSGAGLPGTAGDADGRFDSQEELRALIAASPVPIFAYDPDGVVTLWNAAAERVFGWSEDEAVGRLLPIVPEEMLDEFHEVRARVLAGGAFSGYETVRRRKDGVPIEVSFWNAPVRDASGGVRGVVALVDDITERKRGERRLAAQYAVTSILAEAGGFDEAAPRVLETLGRILGWDAGAVWRPDDEPGVLRCVATWSAGPDAAGFAVFTSELTLGEGEDLPGRAWADGEPRWVADLSEDEGSVRRPLVAGAGLSTGLAFPVLVSGEVLAVVELFCRERLQRDDGLLRALDVVASQLGQFAERRRAERQRAELVGALAWSEQRYRSLVETMAEIVWVTDSAGFRLEGENQWTSFTGQSAQEAAGDGWLDVVHPDDRDRVSTAWDSALREGVSYEQEYRLRGEDGLYRHVVSRGAPVRDQGGAVREWVGICVDVGLRKRREHALSFLAEASAVLASSLDYQATLRRVTRLAVPAFADWCLIDIAREDGGAERLEVAHADPAKHELAERVRHFGPGADWETPQARVLRSGEPILIADMTADRRREVAHDPEHLRSIEAVGPRSIMYVPLEARGRVLGAITFLVSESGRRYDEDDLLLAADIARRAAVAVDNARLYHDAEERGQAARVLAAIGDGVLLVDGDGIVRLWNPAAESITGLAAASAVGRHVADVIPNWDTVAPRIPVAAAGSPAGRAETMPFELAGRELWLSFSGVGSPEGTVYAFRDLTEERRVDRLKSDFVATVSHELRTPLAAVYGAAMTLRRDDLDLDDRTQDGLLGVIADQSDRLAGIVNDILLASRLDTDGLTVGREPVDPAEVARAVVDAARTHAPDEIELELRAPDGLPPVAAVADRMRQVLANLVENAVKYSPEGGAVTVSLAEDDGRLLVSVRDPGIGIPATEQERIFERFYRLDPHLTRGVGGTGLGLYICRELVRRMGGRIWVESRLGEGSTFSFELPLA